MARILLILFIALSPLQIMAADSDGDMLSTLNTQAAPGSSNANPALPIPPQSVPGRSAALDNADAPYEYHIGVRDLIEIQVFQADELNHTSRVNAKGNISIPLLGAVKVKGLMVEDAERLIEQLLKEKYMQDPHVTLFVKEYESQKITVEGSVKGSGVFPLKGQTTLIQAIAMAQGFDRLADPDQITIFRKNRDGNTVGYIVNGSQVRRGEVNDPLVYDGDVIVVPENGGKAFIENITKTLRGFIGFGTL